MINELRIGNAIASDYKKEFHYVNKEWLLKMLHPANDAEWVHYHPILLSPYILEKTGFVKLPHFNWAHIMHIPIGRSRILSVGSVGTPNEMIIIQEVNEPIVKDQVVLRNFDYDGPTYLHDIQNIYQSITKKELKIKSN